MSDDMDSLVNQAFTEDATRTRPKHPEGWEPGVKLQGNMGVIVTRATEERDPRWDEHLRSWGFDPELFDVVEPIQVRTWDSSIGNGETKQLWYYKADIISRLAAVTSDVEGLVKEIKQSRASKRVPPPGDHAFLVGYADWQIGKLGTDVAVEHILDATHEAVARIKQLRRNGVSIGSIYIAALGDLIEGTDGQYAMQTYSVEYNRREQARIARRLLVKIVKTLAPHAERIVALSIPGNHPENRKNGKAYTSFGDNDDLGLMEQVADIFAENPDAFGHVSFVVPDEQLTVTLDIAGTVTCFAHGHQFPKSQGGAWKWWDLQSRSMRPAGDASLLVSGHRHHLHVHQEGPRTFIQCPTVDAGSQWFEETRGGGAPPGVATFTVGPEGWSNLLVL